MTILQAIKWAKIELNKSCERPLFEAQLLLAYHLDCERIYLHTHENKAVENIQAYQKLIQRRANHEPFEYIVGKADFYDISLKVTSGVLIPRPETELLIDHVAKIIEQKNIKQIAEIGIGSGAISIVLARKFPHLQIIATDICDTPLEVSQENIKSYRVESQIVVRKSNLIDAVSEPIELVVSNPPYIANDFPLESNVVDYEPREALFGGNKGDELLKQIIDDVKAKNIRYLACEMGYDQKDSIEAYLNQIEIKYLRFYTDLAGFDRGFVVEF